MENGQPQRSEQDLKNILFSEPSSHEMKPPMVEYLSILAHRLRDLTTEQLLGDEGHAIAMDITGALAFQGADGVEGDDWITPEKEPLLFNILNTAAILDANPYNPEAWQHLLELLDTME